MAFFASNAAGFAEDERFDVASGGRHAQLQLRIRDKSPTPLILTAEHSFQTFAAMQRFDLDSFEPDPEHANDMHFGIKWKAIALRKTLSWLSLSWRPFRLYYGVMITVIPIAIICHCL